ncbi:MAG: hypothetical protein HOO06_09700 [Bdellovibrionaceae bacterium]|jgi:tRNA U34 5-methylaminomethyl-2-thiouridine-forming methyltransferase MnmC|nr:hypothetical protein [Pseudobdellovibrionaceae bacterium]
MSNFNYKIQITADGSPSLELIGPRNTAETMHSKAGAFEESLYIYLRVVKSVVEQDLPLSFYSLGLGLGYNEFILISYLISVKTDMSQLKIVSSEHHPELIDQLKLTVQNHSEDRENISPIQACYHQVIKLCTEYFKISKTELYTKVSELIQNNQWEFHSALNQSCLAKNNIRFSGIFYDAFSEQFAEDLWQEKFLTEFLKTHAAKNCIVSSYAAKGTLRRALEAQGFQLKKSSGFKGKRESTNAVRLN